jgi:hypothetical protein
MRTVVAWALLSLLSRSISASPPTDDHNAVIVGQNADSAAGSAEASAADDEGVPYTTFNGINVPQMEDIEGEKFNETIKDGYW